LRSIISTLIASTILSFSFPALAQEITQTPVITETLVEPKVEKSIEDSEIHCLTLAIFFEAKGEPIRGQEAVAHAVMNRVNSKRFPNTICGVVKQRIAGRPQFDFMRKSEASLRPKPREMTMWETAMDIAKKIIVREQDPLRGATSFYNPHWGRPGRLTKVVSIQIGNHIFYR
jgi:spore germination cell wall hydrolase CwlJ-like protein